MQQRMTGKIWLSLLGLMVSAFLVNTSEYIPIGLLTDIAADFGIGSGQAGLLISVYALVVMLFSLPLMLLASRVPYKRLLIGTLAVFTVFQFLSAASHSFAALMGSRIGVALAHSIFWSIATPLAVKIVPESHRALAISLVATGTSVAMIAGMPLGRMIGLWAGWRVTFLVMGVISAMVAIFLLLVFPHPENGGGFSLRSLPTLFQSKALLSLYCMMVLMVTAYYTCYSYIEPFLEQVAGLTPDTVTFVLMLYGAAGLLGSFFYAHTYRRSPLRFLRIVMIGMAVVLFLLRPAAAGFVTIAALCALWGMTVTCFNISLQGEVIHCAPEGGSAVATSIYSGLYNLGISLGSRLGAVVSTGVSISALGFAGGSLAVIGALYCCLRFTRLLGAYDRFGEKPQERNDRQKAADF